MAKDLSEYDNELATPTLMRAARGAYASAVRASLKAVGVEDLPRNGAFILVGIGGGGGPRQDLPAGLGVTKQAVSQVVDILVRRGYLERDVDSGDRRRISLRLTDRGELAAAAVVRGVDLVDAKLAELVPQVQIDAARSVLISLSQIKVAGYETGFGRRRPKKQLRSFAPIFTVRDLGEAISHYSSLGFRAFAFEEGNDYGFANREGTSIHFDVDPDHDPMNGSSAYLYVRDADALYEEWTRTGIGGTTLPVGTMAYDMREGSHVDPDGNLIRFGSDLGD